MNLLESAAPLWAGEGLRLRAGPTLPVGSGPRAGGRSMEPTTASRLPWGGGGAHRYMQSGLDSEPSRRGVSSLHYLYTKNGRARVELWPGGVMAGWSGDTGLASSGQTTCLARPSSIILSSSESVWAEGSG
jgi:hypothetical protein